jgi:serine/threonine-protein kinase
MIDDPEARARVGHVLNDKWTLETLLGVGGMGAVYGARHRNGARAAVKLLHADLARHPEVRERFLREGKAANKVEHPGVVQVIDDDVVSSGPDEGSAYLVMELLAGVSLEERMERGPKIDERELLKILDEVLDVLAAAHARGVVHRDLKPENLFLARDDKGATRVKVLDFGLARLRDTSGTTRYGVALGTPSYMSPEQASGRHDEVDGRSDLFSLAASAFRIVCGRKVHEGEGPVDQVLKMANVPAPRVHDVAPGVSQPVARVIDKALQFKRDDRYRDAATMRDEVRRSLADLGVPLVPAELAATVIGPPPVSVRAAVEPTLEVSARDLEAPATAKAKSIDLSARHLESVAEPPPPSKLKPPAGAAIEESIPGPPMRRRSMIPLVTVLVLGGIAAKVALDARETMGADAADAGVTEAAVVVPPAPLVPVAVTVDAGSDAADASDARVADASDAAGDAPEDAAVDAPADEDAEEEDFEEEEEDASLALEPLPKLAPSAPVPPRAPHTKPHTPKPRVRRHRKK